MSGFTRRGVTLVDLAADSCGNSYGVAPCTAAGAPGSECYNSFRTCQDRANFARVTKSRLFCSPGAPLPVGESYRPYLTSISTAATEIDLEKGLARRAGVTLAFEDSPDGDRGEDPYIATRTAPAQGSWWARLLARHNNLAGRWVTVSRAYLPGGWDAAAFTHEKYILDRVDPPDSSGRVAMTLKDPTKLADRVRIPAPSGGQLAAGISAAAGSLTLESGQGADYPASGTVRIDSEVIEYATNVADVLGGLTRAVFGTVAAAHSAGDGVQLCRAWTATPVWQVLRDLWLDSGMPLANIDAAGFQAEDDSWLGTGYYVTACISEPAKASELVSDLAVQVGGFMWWDPVAQQVRFKVLAPLSPGEAVAATLTDANGIVEDSVKVTVLEELRKTAWAIWYAPRSAADDADEPVSYLRGQIYLDPAAASANEYGDNRDGLVFSRWFSTANDAGMATVAGHRIGYYRDAPRNVELLVDAKDETIRLGDLVDVVTAALVGFDGAPEPTRCLVIRRRDEGGRIRLVLRTTQFGIRYAFIAPDGAAAYPADIDFVHICQDDGKFADGTSGYVPF